MRAYKPKRKKEKKKIAFEHFPTKIKQNTISYFAERERERERDRDVVV